MKQSLPAAIVILDTLDPKRKNDLDFWFDLGRASGMLKCLLTPEQWQQYDQLQREDAYARANQKQIPTTGDGLTPDERYNS